jgi:hypothetical protein
MTTATAALDPAATIAAAMRELYDQLREIVDRGPTDNPDLLDEIGRLTGRIRRRITGARKKAEPAAEQPANNGTQIVGTPGEKDGPPPSVTPGGARHAAPLAADGSQRREALSADAPTVPRHRAVSVTLPARRADEVTVRLPRAGGRHRQATPRLPLWVHTLVILLMVGGIALGTAVTASAFAALPIGAVLLGAAHRWNVRRRSVLGGAR